MTVLHSIQAALHIQCSLLGSDNTD